MVHYLTANGLKEIEAEYKHLCDVLLPEIIDSINKAMEDGDIKENSPLESAKSERDTLLLRKNELEEVLANYEVIDDSTKSKYIKIGSTVKIQYLSNNDTYTFQIVGGSEADVLANKISNESPIAVAIIGKTKGDIADINLNSKQIQIKILEIIS